MTSDGYTNDELRTMAFENAAAVMKYNHIWVTGYWSIVQSMKLAAQSRLEQRWSTWMSITRRSLTESAELTQASLQLMERTMEPIAARIVRPAESSSSPGA